MAARARARYELVADDRTTAAFASVRNSMDRTRQSARRLVGQIAALTGVAGLGALVRESVTAANEIGKLARQFDVSTEFLSEYRGVLSIVGVDQTKFVNGLRALQKAIRDANDGLTTQQRAFGALGIQLDEISKLPLEDQFFAIIEGLRRLGPGFRQAAVGADVLGSRNLTLLRIANTTREEIERLRQEQIALGRSLSEEQTTAAEDVIDAYDRIGQAIGALVDELTLAAAPAVTALADTFRQVLIPVINFVRLSFLRVGRIIGAIGAAIVFLFQGEFSRAADVARSAFDDVVDNLQKTFDLIRDPFGFTDSQQRSRIRAGAERVKNDIEQVFKGGAATTLLDDEITKIQQFIGALRAVINARREAQSGSAAQVDTSLQSLSTTVRSGDARMLDQLKSIERLLQQRKLLEVMRDIRDVLGENQGNAAVFGS